MIFEFIEIDSSRTSFTAISKNQTGIETMETVFFSANSTLNGRKNEVILRRFRLSSFYTMNRQHIIIMHNETNLWCARLCDHSNESPGEKGENDCQWIIVVYLIENGIGICVDMKAISMTSIDSNSIQCHWIKCTQQSAHCKPQTRQELNQFIWIKVCVCVCVCRMWIFFICNLCCSGEKVISQKQAL